MPSLPKENPEKTNDEFESQESVGRSGTSRVNQLKVLLRIADLINTTSNKSTLLRRILRETIDTFGAYGGLIALLNSELPHSRTLTIEAEQREDEDYSPGNVMLKEHFATRAFEGEGVTRSSGDKDKASEMATMLKLERESIGVLYIHKSDEKGFSRDEERLLGAIASQAARIINTSSQYERLSRQTERLESLFEMAQVLIGTNPLPEVLNRVTESILTILDVKQCTVLLVGKSHDLQLSASSGKAGHYTQRRESTDSLIRKLSTRGEPVRVLDVRKPEGRRPGKLPKAERSTTLLAVPIFYQQTLVGILNVYTPEPRHFDPEEMRLFKAYASLCGVAIENARHHEQMLSTAEQIRLADRAGTLAAVGNEVAQRVRNSLGAENLVLDALRDEGAFPPGRGEDYEVLMHSLRKIDHTIGRVQELGRRRTPQLEWLEINQIVDDVLALCRHRLAARQIMIHRRLASDLPRILADTGEMLLVLLHAITNAMDSMRHGGILNVSTSLLATAEDDAGIPMIRVNVRDTGRGLDPRLSNQILDPFERETGSPSGFGLFVAESFVKKYGGRLTIRNATDHGTSVSLTMPALERRRN